MTNQHPITPPPELVQQWAQNRGYSCPNELWEYLATQAARWGADQELEACIEWLDRNSPVIGGFHLRIDRRPKPPSLRELAMESVKRFEESGEFFADQMRELAFIRKALEQLDD